VQAQPDIQIDISRPAAEVWEQLPCDQPLPLQQHPAYADALAHLGTDTAQLTFQHAGAPVAIALISRRRLYGALRLTTLLRGPVFLTAPAAPDLQAAVFKALRQAYSRWRWNFLVLQPELPATPATAALLKDAGLRRIVTGYTTAWLDLSPDEATLRTGLAGKWRNQLKAAEKANLSVTIGGRRAHQYAWLLEQEGNQRGKHGYHAVPLGLVDHYGGKANKGDGSILSITAIKGRDKVAGGLFLLHGNSATYHIGWAGKDGRRVNAQNRVLWDAVLALKERGIRYLDLGGMETATQAGITRFKLGLGAKPVTFTGTWA